MAKTGNHSYIVERGIPLQQVNNGLRNYSGTLVLIEILHHTLQLPDTGRGDFQILLPGGQKAAAVPFLQVDKAF